MAKKTTAVSNGPVKLSNREWEIVFLIVALAQSNKEIAYELGLTEGTVKEYLNRIFVKLNLANRNRSALALWWERQMQEIRG